MAKQTRATAKNVTVGKNVTITKGSKAVPAAKTVQMHSMMEKFFIDQLKDLYYVEKNQIRSLGRLAKKATTEELRDILMEHQETTQQQLTRLDQVFEILGKKAQARKCPVMEGLQEEADEMLGETEDDTLTRDVALIVTAQKIEHYEIASYGCLTTLARTYGMDDIAELLHESLEEEKQADQELTYIAENNINFEAGQEEEED